MKRNATNQTDGPWVVSGPHILKKHNGEYDGEGWHVNRPHPRSGKHSAREWIMDGELVKFFKSEKAANSACDSANKHNR